MKGFRGRGAASLLAGLCLAWSGSAAAARMGVDPVRFNRALLSGDQDRGWTWAAGMEQILRYYGLEIKQEEISRRVYGANLDGTTRTNLVFGVEDSINRCMKTTDDAGRPFTVKMLDWQRAPAAQLLQGEFSAQRPILALLKLPEGQQYLTGMADQIAVHVVIIESGDDEPDADGTPKFKSIEIWDPSITQRDPNNPGFMTLTPLQFRSQIMEYWTIRVNVAAPTGNAGVPSVDSPFRQPADTGQLFVRGWALPVSGISGYNLYMSDVSGKGFKKVNLAPITGESILIRGVTTNRQYYLCLTSLSAQTPPVESRPSAEWSVMGKAEEQ